jgi:uncharacterized protein YggU (UPF0235/DUF167 family)
MKKTAEATQNLTSLLHSKGRAVDGALHIWITVKPGSKNEGLEVGPGDDLILRVSARAKEGEANERVVALMAELLKLPKSRIRVVRGFAARKKELAIG